MVEMTEAAYILHHATPNSLVLMDEIGRGTSTFDGLSLAWACAIDLADRIKAYTLFATHYFELTLLPEQHQGVFNRHLSASEHGEKIIFLHRVQEGPANQSYGLQVAKLAGLPKDVIQNAQIKLHELEQQEFKQAPIPALDKEALIKQTLNKKPSESEPSTQIMQNDLFAAPSLPQKLISTIEDIKPDELTPKAALDLIYELIKLRDQ
jgi:DNA mismatch repair protein MutS